MNNNNSIRVVVPAAGRSSRSGLDYPKTLYRLNGVPILIKLLRKFQQYDATPILIINPAHQPLFDEVLAEFSMKAEYAYQRESLGMGHAILQAGNHVKEDEHILLVWSDIPFLHANTIDTMVQKHLEGGFDFSFVSAFCDSCYTVVKRENGKVTALLETRALGLPPGKGGERDIGLFIFRKKPLFTVLETQAESTLVNGKPEYGFLYAVEKLASAGYLVEAFPVALEQDVMSFNTPEELKAIENSPWAVE